MKEPEELKQCNQREPRTKQRDREMRYYRCLETLTAFHVVRRLSKIGIGKCHLNFPTRKLLI